MKGILKRCLLSIKYSPLLSLKGGSKRFAALGDPNNHMVCKLGTCVARHSSFVSSPIRQRKKVWFVYAIDKSLVSLDLHC